MANDGGMTASLEQWLADTLKALKYLDKDVFKTSEPWAWQITAGTSGNFSKMQPFAFSGYQLDADGFREGGGDLRQQLKYGVVIGVKSTVDGVAKNGDTTHLGISKIRELVIAAIDKHHPDNGLNCDDFMYEGEMGWVDKPRQCAIQLNFTCNWIM